LSLYSRGKSGRNKKAKRAEETNKVKQRTYFVKREFFRGRGFALINADKRNLKRMNAKDANHILVS
jgi:hypothetical protein